jgi:tRNA dimethylallyltransferase
MSAGAKAPMSAGANYPTSPRGAGDPPLVMLLGPTASGKTAAALAIAERLPVEIVSVDSALVYRGMDIGTAKPGAAERAALPHHLIALIEPEQAYSAAQFVQDATAAAAAVRARGRLPLLVGGTMLYFKALRDGLDAMPASDADLRARLDARAAAEGWPALHAELARVDPATAARLAPGDAQRIQRALEVWQASGRPLSSFHARRDDAATRRQWPLISLEPTSRAWLHARIAQRFDAMLAAGFVDEVLRLRRRPLLRPQMPSMRCVGYRQAWTALDAGVLDAGALDKLREAGIAATRQLAKRQLTWLRSMDVQERIACDASDVTTPLLEALRRLLGG